MNRKKKILFATIGIFIILFAIIGITYAYFVARVQGNTSAVSIQTKAGILSLVYGEGQNDVIEATNILPGYTNTKNFTVTNNGTGTASYGVFLEELRNTFTRTSDLKLTITCTSSVENKECNGLPQSNFPTQNDLLITNSIDKDEVQTYTLTLEYLNANENQNADNNASLFAKVQIYDLDSTVDLSGTVENSQPGDYVVVNSEPKRSEIVNGTFKVVGLEPDNHTINVYNESGTQKSTNSLSIVNGAEESISGTTVTIVESSRTITSSVNATSNNSVTISDIEQISNSSGNTGNIDTGIDTSGTLAYEIINNAKNVTPEQKAAGYTEYLSNPKTTVGSAISTYKTGNYGNQEFNEQYKNTAYADSYESCVSGGGTRFTTCDDSLIGKTICNVDGGGYSYQVVSCIDDYNIVGYTELSDSEKTLSVETDDYGDSYYFRGNMIDNYINFAGMCWRIVRIAGDGSIKLILEDKNTTCDSASFTGEWTLGSSYYGNNEIGKHLYLDANNKVNNMDSLSTIFENFQTTSLNNVLNDLKSGDWCFDNLAYSDDKGENLLTEVERQNTSTYYYSSYVRLGGKDTPEPTLRCLGEKMSTFNDETPMYVATLTLDEVTYAGNKFKTPNNSIYLVSDNYKASHIEGWSLLSPGTNDSKFHMYGSNGNIWTGSYTDTYNSTQVRPAIQLKTGTLYKSGNGTKSNPYEID